MSSTKGFSAIEVVIGAALVAVVATGVAAAWQFYVKLAGQSTRIAQADLLIEEASDAIQYMRDSGWTANLSSLLQGTPYYLVWNGSAYIATTSATTTNGFARVVTFAAVKRDANDNIAATGTTDPGTLQATISIYPGSPAAPLAEQGVMIIHDTFNN